MKNVVFKLSGFFVLSILIWSCSKSVESDPSQVVLKSAITASAQTLNNAMTDISSSQAFQLLNVSTADALKAGTLPATTTTYQANIPLSLIKGVYDYKALKNVEARGYNLIRFFTKSADNSNMIVNMPLSKMKNPRYLRTYQQGDSALANNFTISVSNYHNNYNSYHDYDYVNVADFSIDNVKAGSMNMQSSVSPTLGKNYISQFDFSNGYTAKYMYASGDTTVSSFTLIKASNIVYQEKLVTVKTQPTNMQGDDDSMKFGRERQYTLTIGNVTIVRETGTAPKVYVNGQLQSKAVVSVVDEDENEESEHSVLEKRDLKITFDDGTTSTVSALIGQSITDISSIYKSLHQVYFAAYIVDWLGYDIYYKRN